MRILMTTDTVGGVWTFTRELTYGLLDKGCEIILVSFGCDPKEEQQRWTSAMHTLFKGRFRFLSSGASLEWMQDNEHAFSEASKFLLSVVSKFRIDVLHANQFCLGALHVSMPKVVTAHSDVLSWADACRTEALPESDWLRRYRELVQRGLNGASIIIAPTRSVLEGLSHHFALRDASSFVIANGRSLPHAQCTTRIAQAVTAGRMWDEAKGIAMLQEVQSPIPIMVAGEQSLGGCPASMDFGPLHCLGSLDEETLLSLFAGSALYICSSKYEPFGLAPLEAALSGCAILANDLPSLREIWGDSALYFRDAASLSKTLSRVYEDACFLKDMQARCYARAQLYSRERMADTYYHLYQRLLKQEEDISDVAQV